LSPHQLLSVAKGEFGFCNKSEQPPFAQDFSFSAGSPGACPVLRREQIGSTCDIYLHLGGGCEGKETFLWAVWEFSFAVWKP